MLRQEARTRKSGNGAGKAFYNETGPSWPMPFKEEPSRAAGAAAAEGEGNGAAYAPADSINIYFREIKRFKLLSAEEERELARRIARGDAEARRKMIESNLRLVVNIAKRYVNRGLQLQDLIDEGNIGLIKAAERFKASIGCRFSTYATYWIKQTIERALANKGSMIRLPIHIVTDISKVERAAREFRVLSNRDPSASELSEKTGLSGRYVKRLEVIKKRTVSLESQCQDESDCNVLDSMEDEAAPAPVEFIEESRRAERVASWLSLLDENEQKIISLRFGIGDYAPKTLEVIGRRFGVTRERVRQIEEKALMKLRAIATDHAGCPSDLL
ncbi:MAG: sigma-70 family RNA polymerase sigma factor [Deltaproteobacteria bacterium]|nr:sigma-70 family RNA polymerase sigma factor [Deltaproteobacteria bacterium]MCL4873001.1 sigma-70 family RNA polymerase sigma factor [bacterium]